MNLVFTFSVMLHRLNFFKINHKYVYYIQRHFIGATRNFDIVIADCSSMYIKPIIFWYFLMLTSSNSSFQFRLFLLAVTYTILVCKHVTNRFTTQMESKCYTFELERMLFLKHTIIFTGIWAPINKSLIYAAMNSYNLLFSIIYHPDAKFNLDFEWAPSRSTHRQTDNLKPYNACL